MKRTWRNGYDNDQDYGKPVGYDRELYFDDVHVATVRRMGDWWEAVFTCCADAEAPDGMRFASKRAAIRYTSKHATVLWIGNRYEGHK